MQKAGRVLANIIISIIKLPNSGMNPINIIYNYNNVLGSVLQVLVI